MTDRNYLVVGETKDGFQILSKGDSLGAGPLSEEEASARLRFYQRRLGGDYKNMGIARVEFKRNGKRDVKEAY